MNLFACCFFVCVFFNIVFMSVFLARGEHGWRANTTKFHTDGQYPYNFWSFYCQVRSHIICQCVRVWVWVCVCVCLFVCAHHLSSLHKSFGWNYKLRSSVCMHMYAKRSHTRVKDPKVHVTAPHLWNEPLALHRGSYIALFSAFEQTHCALVVCNSEWVTVALQSTFFNIHRSGYSAL